MPQAPMLERPTDAGDDPTRLSYASAEGTPNGDVVIETAGAHPENDPMAPEYGRNIDRGIVAKAGDAAMYGSFESEGMGSKEYYGGAGPAARQPTNDGKHRR